MKDRTWNRSQSKYEHTARLMDEALISLLEKKNYEFITVKEICEKAGIPDVDAIGILTLTPGETAIIAGDMAVRSADVNVAFLDRFSGTLILYGSVGAVEQALTQVNDMLNRLLQFTICPVTRH